VGSQILDLDYKIKPTADHAATFHNDRPTALGDLALKGKRNISGKTRPPRLATKAGGLMSQLQMQMNLDSWRMIGLCLPLSSEY